jgi:DNA modification methylase
MSAVTIHTGDSRQVLRTMPENSVDAIVTDPPYELGFMNKAWDRSGIANDVKFWDDCLRVLKPGGHLLAFSGSRTYHRMACAIEDAGFEVRDQMMWVYGNGFPKSLNVAKAIDSTIRLGGSNTRKLRQTEQETGGDSYQLKGRNGGIMGEEKTFDRKEWKPTTDEAKKWDGWGTALKPAHEPICVARKPLVGTVAENVLKYGTGAINIDGTRICPECGDDDATEELPFCMDCVEDGAMDQGRWPANLMHDGSEDVLGLFPGDANLTAARFFYCPKASKRDRNEGLEGFEERRESDRDKDDGVGGDNPRNRTNKHRLNNHPTVKPTELMRYLCRLVTPPGGTILDPFLGSGSTGKAAALEGFNFVGIELSAEYTAIAKARIDHALKNKC